MKLELAMRLQRRTSRVVVPVVDAGNSGPAGNGLLLEDGTSFLLAEDGSYLIQES